MDLILWRHADAIELQGNLSDLERPLTPKGERQAQRMALAHGIVEIGTDHRRQDLRSHAARRQGVSGHANQDTR